MLKNLFIVATSELMPMGLTITDWVAVITLAGSFLGLLIGAIKLIDDLRHAIADLNDTIKDMNEANERRDRDYQKLSEHLAQHDSQFVKDEERIAELFRLLNHGGINHGKN